MADIEVNDLASIGAIRDVDAYQLPPEAWSLADNMRFRGQSVERLGGRAQVFGTPGVAPHFALPIQSPSQTYWLYVSLTKAYVYDGSSHTNITRQTAAADVDYTASATREWNGTLFGGVPILNNGVDAPQYWSSLNTATKLAALANWPASTTARTIRAFGPYLVALDVTKSTGTQYPHLVKWSHPADPGSVPSSWDETDPTKDAGEKDLPDVNAGIIRDGLPLRGHFYIYKEGSVWRMSVIGGQFIFNFDTFLETAGILAPHCVTITGDGTRHVFATQDDIVVHNGNSVESILDARYKKYLVNNIDTSNYLNSFMFTDAFRDEVWFCYPESGNTNPNKALIWNYKTGQRGALSEADVNFRNVIGGTIESASDTVWSGASGAWDAYLGPWSQSVRRKLVACGTDATKFFELDSGVLNNGGALLGTLQRTGLAMVGRKRNGEWIVDFKKRKLFTRLWIKAEGGPINVRVGSQESPDGVVTWTPAKAFDPSTQKYLDFTVSGMAIGVEFSASATFRISGYKPEISLIGEF